MPNIQPTSQCGAAMVEQKILLRHCIFNENLYWERKKKHSAKILFLSLCVSLFLSLSLYIYWAYCVLSENATLTTPILSKFNLCQHYLVMLIGSNSLFYKYRFLYISICKYISKVL